MYFFFYNGESAYELESGLLGLNLCLVFCLSHGLRIPTLHLFDKYVFLLHRLYMHVFIQLHV